MADRGFSNDELRLYELLQQFLALSDDTEVAGRIIFLGPTGQIVGDASLAARDIEEATDALLALNIRKADVAEGLVPAEPLLDVDADDAADLVAETEAFLANGGLA